MQNVSCGLKCLIVGDLSVTTQRKFILYILLTSLPNNPKTRDAKNIYQSLLHLKLWDVCEQRMFYNCEETKNVPVCNMSQLAIRLVKKFARVPIELTTKWKMWCEGYIHSSVSSQGKYICIIETRWVGLSFYSLSLTNFGSEYFFLPFAIYILFQVKLPNLALFFI